MKQTVVSHHRHETSDTSMSTVYHSTALELGYALNNIDPDPQTPADSGDFTEQWWGKYGDFTSNFFQS